MTDIERALIGLVVVLVGALAFIVKQRRGGNGHSIAPTAAQLALIQEVKDHVTETERRIMKNIDDTRHAVNNGVQSVSSEILTEIKERRTRGR